MEICGQTIQWAPLLCGKAVIEPSASRITRIAVAILGLLMVGGGLSMVFGMSGWTGLIPIGWSVGGVGIVATLCALAFRCVPAVPPVSLGNANRTVQQQQEPSQSPQRMYRFPGRDHEKEKKREYYTQCMGNFPDGSWIKIIDTCDETWVWKKNGKVGYYTCLLDMKVPLADLEGLYSELRSCDSELRSCD
jgi:hypothetical protein